jgi:glycolate oxidase
MTTTDTLIRNDDSIAAVLTAIVGPEAVLTTLEQRTFYSTDISGTAEVAEAVVQVRTVDELSRVVSACTSRDYQVIPRGGGFSYTGGYTPTSAKTVIVDLRPMDRILEINLQDMYVVVEVGCTWRNLYEALKVKGVRTPYFGPMSGYRATIGGALSQGSFFLGSTQHGPVADSVLGLEAVLADGTVLKTGSGASSEGTPPFFRQYGPDATGLFLSDTGAMGFKTKAVLRLIPFPAHQAYGSFAFTSHKEALAAVSKIGRTGIAAECYCWDPHFVRVMAASGSLGVKDDLRYLLNVVKAGAGLVDGLGAAFRMALAGRRVFSGDTWLLHVVIDDPTAEGAAAKLKLIRAMARQGGGSEVSPSAPRTLRGTPFTDFNVPERRTPLRNIPINSLSPHSRAPAVADELYALIAERHEEMERYGVECGVIFFAVGAQTVCIEPLIYWTDERHYLHNRIEEVSDVDSLAAQPDRPAQTAFAMDLREEIKSLFRRHGCIHVQVGRAYAWAATRDPAHLALITAVKDVVDPARLVNRGSLGFGEPAPRRA